MRAVLLLALCAALLGVGLVEIAARIVASRSCVDEIPGIATRSPFYGWGYAPGTSGWAQRCLRGAAEWQSHVRINAEGLRDREIPLERSSAERILVLGDSFSAGVEVALDDVVAKRLERTLNAPDPPGTHVEVVNAG